jgi:hypothetical protein
MGKKGNIMKTTLRTALCLLLTLCLLLPLSSCGETYRDDLTAITACHAVKNALPAGKGWTQVSQGFINGSDWGEDFLDHLDKTSEHCILVSAESDMNIDEIGVFRVAKSSDVKEIEKFVKDYVSAKQIRMKSLLESYNTAELPKLDCAKVTVCGSYVFYTILNAEDTAAAHKAFEDALRVEE